MNGILPSGALWCSRCTVSSKGHKRAGVTSSHAPKPLVPQVVSDGQYCNRDWYRFQQAPHDIVHRDSCLSSTVFLFRSPIHKKDITMG